MQELYNTVQQLISKPSVTPSDEGCLDFIALYLAKLGFQTEIITFEEEGHEPVKNLYAKYGSGGKHLTFAGHVDVVPVGDAKDWQYDPFSASINEDVLYGRGAVDMKGAIACCMHAVSKNISKIGNNTVSFIITADEEGVAVNGTKKLMKYLSDKGEKFDYCIIGEPTCVNKVGDTIKNGAKGSANFRLQVNGKQGHVAFIGHNKNPVDDMGKVIANIASYNWNYAEVNKRFSKTNLEFTSLKTSSNACNVVPENATAEFNIRYNDDYSEEKLLEVANDICKNSNINYALELLYANPCFYVETTDNTNLLKDAILEVTGVQPQLSTNGGTSDARFIKEYCEVVEFGALGATAHQVNENIPLSDLDKLYNIYSLLIQKFYAKITK